MIIKNNMRTIFYLLLIHFSYAFVKLQNTKVNRKLQDNYLNNDLVNGLGIVVLSLPSLMKQGGNCKVDDDCPFIMRCCKVGSRNYCCSPNNFISLDLAYNKQFISTNTTTKI